MENKTMKLAEDRKTTYRVRENICNDMSDKELLDTKNSDN